MCKVFPSPPSVVFRQSLSGHVSKNFPIGMAVTWMTDQLGVISTSMGTGEGETGANFVSHSIIIIIIIYFQISKHKYCRHSYNTSHMVAKMAKSSKLFHFI